MQQLLDLLLAKYRTDPEKFRSYLPEVAQTLDALYPHHHVSRNPFGLTEHERSHRLQALHQVLESLSDGTATPEKAIRGLEHCATLIEDDSLPPEVDYAVLNKLVRAVIGKSPGSFKSASVIPVQEHLKDKVVHRVAVLRGVTLELTWDRRLVSIAINPRKVQERRKLLQFVGTASDPASDVALLHDDYLAGMEPHVAP